MKKIYNIIAVLIIALCSNSISNAQNQGPILANKLIDPEPQIIQNVNKEHFVWIDGQWKVKNNTYTWVSGHWAAKKPEHIFVNGKWIKKNNGWVWTEGYWQKDRKIKYIRLYA